MIDLKVVNSVLTQLEEERGIPKEKIIEAIELALATAYKKEYGKKGQIVRAKFDLNTGKTEMFQVKIVVDENTVFMTERPDADVEPAFGSKSQKAKSDVVGAEGNIGTGTPDAEIELYNPEHHIMLSDARRIKKDIALGDEMVFPLESQGDYGRIAAQTAKQVIMQKIREAEKIHIVSEYGKKEGEIVSGTVQRMERGNIFIDMGRAPGILPYEEQIPGERFAQGERVRAYLYRVEDSSKGVFLRLSRSHPKFLEKLFETETPEIANGTVVVKSIAREAGSRTKIAVTSKDAHIDPVGSMVGGRGVRVSTVMSELGGEKIDIIEWSEAPKKFIEDALSPAKVLSVEINETEKQASVTVSEDQQSLAIGKGGQNVRLAAKLTGWKIDIKSTNPRGEIKDLPAQAEENAGEATVEIVEEK
ncbi:MAG: NusA antitermination factor [Parcubacteria group bacterium GW2011_GWF2_39_8b]|uniref:Transcription termination/antitermination protein NusA n=2 Tax=Candidatus Zambryskiibacteriota TaxID=1817925 RepID=A0A1G2T917_9BACT|nr:MAG: NusA antitermination factor [Parcubacteria group bacterium GW2011_GWF2_39_8b]OHA93091.1 MAG: transcription termination factor NusA [Candidatus Zambryskibacteria bacterium RIFCSPHIGHO2_02_38_10.5]OHA95689.1 MAG: transcription termination factor NusA [Candidatus Zambryskibacteria bacterium RIFCSPHIGHO2_02_FULL_39_82]OHA98587.1 MAG: transcription termination factor NusA [Candidatus Zambryskibacteria bacterium RIFCSPHIGHO2_12_FULL_38_37]OHB09203.1 MAG: transcription termination factor NusA 